jgi:hypothetical protein
VNVESPTLLNVCIVYSLCHTKEKSTRWMAPYVLIRQSMILLGSETCKRKRKDIRLRPRDEEFIKP